MQRPGVLEAVPLHVLDHYASRSQAKHPIAFGFVGLADCPHGVALARPCLANDDRQPFGASRSLKRRALLGVHGRELFEDGGLMRGLDAVAFARRQRGGAVEGR